jgi:hypothetical protein
MVDQVIFNVTCNLPFFKYSINSDSYLFYSNLSTTNSMNNSLNKYHRKCMLKFHSCDSLYYLICFLSTDWSFFAVFDGHCGSTVSSHCAANLLPTIIETDDFKKVSPETAESDESNNETESNIRRAIHTGFLKYNLIHFSSEFSYHPCQFSQVGRDYETNALRGKW